MVQVSDRYLPSRLGRISSVAGSKSGACRRTTSITACANPFCVSPMILIGNSQGKARTAESASGMDGGAHHLRLVLLVKRIDTREHRAGPADVLAAADGAAVERGDRHDLARGRRDPHFVGRAQLGFSHR